MTECVILLLLSGCSSIPFERYNTRESIIVPADAPYSEYYLAVRKKIYQYACLYYNQPEQGSVSVRFDIFKNGDVGNVEVDKNKTNASEALINAAIKAIKDASPYSPFPNVLNTFPRLNFIVELSFEIEGYTFGGHTDSSQCPLDHEEMNEVPIVYGRATFEILEQANKGTIIWVSRPANKNSPKTGYKCPVCKKIWLKKV